MTYMLLLKEVAFKLPVFVLIDSHGKASTVRLKKKNSITLTHTETQGMKPHRIACMYWCSNLFCIYYITFVPNSIFGLGTELVEVVS